MSKLARLLGILSAGVSLCLWAFLALTTWNDLVQYEAARNAAVMGLLALGGILVTLLDRPILMIAIFALSFFPVGRYLLGVPSAYMLIGIFDLLYLLAAFILLYYRYQTRYQG